MRWLMMAGLALLTGCDLKAPIDPNAHDGGPATGDTGILKTGAVPNDFLLVARDQADYEEYLNACRAADERRKSLALGQFIMIREGTRVLAGPRRLFSRRIRVLDGPHAGEDLIAGVTQVWKEQPKEYPKIAATSPSESDHGPTTQTKPGMPTATPGGGGGLFGDYARSTAAGDDSKVSQPRQPQFGPNPDPSFPRGKAPPVAPPKEKPPGKSVADLIAELGDPSAQVRTAAALTLGFQGLADANVAVPALRVLLKDPSAEVRAAAEFALKKLGAGG